MLRSELDLGRVLALVEVALEPAGQDLVHRRGVVHRLGAVERGMRVVAPDDEPAVLGLARQAVLEDDHRRDDVGALDVADVEALDPQRRVGQLEGVLELLEGLAAGGEVAGPGHLVPGEGLLGVAADRLHQRPLVAALRDPQVDAMAAQGAEPGGAGPRTRRARSGPGPRAGPGRGCPGPGRRRPAGAGARSARGRPRSPSRPPSRAGRGSGRRGRGTPGRPPRARRRRGRRRRRRCRRRGRPRSSRAPC